MTVAIAMSGGGAKGAFEVGALRYLFDERGVRPDVLCGTSVGSLNALKLAEGAQGPGGEPSAAALDGLERIWRGIRRESDVFVLNPELQTGIDGLVDDARTACAALVAVTLARALVPGLSLILPDVNTDAAVTAALVANLGSVESIFTLDPLREIIADELDVNRVQTSGIELRMSMVDVRTGRIFRVDQTGRLNPVPEPQGATRRVARLRPSTALARDLVADLDIGLLPGHFADIVDRIDPPPALTMSLPDAVIASAAIPVVFGPVPVGGLRLVDGGVREVIPLQPALDLGATEVYAILATSRRLLADLPVGFAALQLARIGEATVHHMVHEITENDLQAQMPDGVELTVISPRVDIQGTLDFGPNIIALNIWYGFQMARATVEGTPPPDDDVVLTLATAARALDTLGILDRLPDVNIADRFDTTLLRARTEQLTRAIKTDRLPAVPGLTAPAPTLPRLAPAPGTATKP